MRGSAILAEKFDEEAAGIAHILETSGWNASAQHFYGFLQPDGQKFGSGDAFILYFNATVASQQKSTALNALKLQTREAAPGIEEQSYRPEIFFRYGAPEEAYSQILDLSRQDRNRREYPEVSYAVIGSIVTGMMGVGVFPADGPTDTLLNSKVVIRTLPQLSIHTTWVELSNLPVRQNVVNIRHLRGRSTSITNVSGPTFLWRASFEGSASFLRVNGKKLRAIAGTTLEGIPIAYTDVSVPSGTSIVVTK
jgi:hypothetical protein